MQTGSGMHLLWGALAESFSSQRDMARTYQKLAKDTDGHELGKRIRAVAELYPSLIKAAEMAGVDRNTLGRWMEGMNEPPLPAIARLCEPVGASVDWVALKRGELLPVATEVREPHAGYAHIPLFDIRARAGNQGSIVEDERILDALAFKEDWIRQELRVRPDDLRLIYVEGDSMEPVLHAGDIILVDHTDTAARREGIYVLRMDGALLVKQLQRLPGGLLRVMSHNEAYEPFTIKMAELVNGSGMAVIGRVVWACRRF